MAASVDKPLLNDHRAGLVTGHRAGVRTDRGCRISAVSALPSAPFTTMFLAFAGWTILSASPWKTIVGTARRLSGLLEVSPYRALIRRCAPIPNGARDGKSQRQAIVELIRDLLIFIAVMFALCIVLIVVISVLPNDNPLKRILTALSYRIGATLAAGMIAIPVEPIPGLDVVYDIAIPIALLWYWFTFFRNAIRPAERSEHTVRDVSPELQRLRLNQRP
jgi:hypothetical protein